MMNEDQDPMLGDKAERDTYKQHVMQVMREAVQETRAERRHPQQTATNDPVMLGSVGQSGGISTAG